MYTYHDIIRVLAPYCSHLLVDRISLFENGEYILAYKNVSLSDIGYTDEKMRLASAPLFVVIESMSQLVRLFLELSGIKGQVEEFAVGALDANILPGDTLCLEWKVVERNKHKLKLEGRVLRDGQIVCQPKARVGQIEL